MKIKFLWLLPIIILFSCKSENYKTNIKAVTAVMKEYDGVYSPGFGYAYEDGQRKTFIDLEVKELKIENFSTDTLENITSRMSKIFISNLNGQTNLTHIKFTLKLPNKQEFIREFPIKN